MDEVQGLRHGLEDRISKHVDVREALLKKKDEQLQGKIGIFHSILINLSVW